MSSTITISSSFKVGLIDSFTTTSLLLEQSVPSCIVAVMTYVPPFNTSKNASVLSTLGSPFKVHS
ncbi:hypothetical protein F7018_16485 [Tenacibaculum aiptasiae]|uniref:Uncharacterized protein n=1 Tax=Tenacibaculum aiptasiae TaxID=426481 RepID=A0A7J5A7K5_9FLAO|nr:hypothetical protein F7018_16485 [Tenacibaculum aiptasiae]